MLHIYFKNIALNPGKKPLFVSECGGYAYLIEGHYYSKYNTYGYGNCFDDESFFKDVSSTYDVMILPSIKDGVCGCVYTQLSDVEDETNGFYTYDRKVCKVDPKKMMEIRHKIDRAIDEI